MLNLYQGIKVLSLMEFIFLRNGINWKMDEMPFVPNKNQGVGKHADLVCDMFATHTWGPEF